MRFGAFNMVIDYGRQWRILLFAIPVLSLYIFYPSIFFLFFYLVRWHFDLANAHGKKESNKMVFDSVLFEDFEVIIWLGQTLTFGWFITIVTVRDITMVFIPFGV